MYNMNKPSTFDHAYPTSNAFEMEDRPDCMSCCDSGTFYDDDGDLDFCECATGTIASEEAMEQERNGRDDGFDDEGAFTSIGWGEDESYGYYG